jgi:prepilin-type N-terminal cleavage/methylation domain-containing protein
MNTGHRRGYTLVEISIALVIMGILAALAYPAFQPNVAVQLEATARVVAADLAKVRQMATANNSTYRLTFEITNNRFYLEYYGSNSALNTLPPTIFPNTLNTSTRQYIDLDDLPHSGPTVYLAAVQTAGSPATNLTTLEFGPLGSTTQAADTVVWLSSGNGDSLRYIAVNVNAVTGLTTYGDIDGTGPATGG